MILNVECIERLLDGTHQSHDQCAMPPLLHTETDQSRTTEWLEL